ncbi:MAG: LysR family transcriptional regulator [Bdellovibrionales bacterium]
MDHLSRIGIFIEVVKHSSFAGAARSLKITSSAVSKQIQNLEHDLQVKLLNRTTRHVSVTEEGAIFFERASRAMEDLQEAEEQIYELKSCPRGTLKISVPMSLGMECLKPTISSFAKKYPEVIMDVSFDDKIVDVIDGGYDLVVRIGALKDSSLIARRLSSCPFVVCASDEYFQKYGIPKHPDDLVHHNVLAYTRNNAPHGWRYKDKNGQEGYVSLQGTFKSDTGEMMSEIALQGLGLTILPIFYVADHIKSGALRSVLQDFQTWPHRDIHAVFPPSRYLSTRLRLFVEHLVQDCKNLPWE